MSASMLVALQLYALALCTLTLLESILKPPTTPTPSSNDLCSDLINPKNPSIQWPCIRRLNDSEDYVDDDITGATCTKRWWRRRRRSPVNLRPHEDLTPESSISSSTETYETSSVSPSAVLQPAPSIFNVTHNSVFDSRRPKDGLCISGIPSTTFDSPLFPSLGSNPRSKSYLLSQNASDRIRQAADRNDKGKEEPPPTKTAKSHPSGSNSTTRSTASVRSVSSAPSRVHSESSKQRLVALEKIKSKIEETKSEKRRQWSIGEHGKLWGQPVAVDESTKTAPPTVGPPPKPQPPGISFESQPPKVSIMSSLTTFQQRTMNTLPTGSRNTIILNHHPSSLRDSLAIHTSPPKKSVTIERYPSSPLISQPSSEVEVSDPPPPADRPQNQTLQRIMTLLNASLGWIVNKLTEDNLGDNVDSADISSDEEEDNLSVEDGDEQLDSEWLDLPDHETINIGDTPTLTHIDSPQGDFTKDSSHPADLKHVSVCYYPLKFTSVMLPVYKAMFYLGRFPFEIDMSEDIPRYKYNRKSWRYWICIGTSVVTFLTAILMISNLFIIVTASDPLTFHETVTKLEQEKYWVEAIIEILNMLFLAISSFSMMDFGGETSIVDFLNRWSSAVSIIRYDVTSGLKYLHTAFFCFYGIYAVTLIILFFAGGESIPTVRGASGFTGLLILNSFTSELRLRSQFRTVQLLGLFVHLYATLAGYLVTLVICMHCWALDNAAKRFNKRLAGCLRGVFRNPASDSSGSRFTAQYPKLFAEHLVVTSIPRHIGKVFCFVFIFYLGCKMIEMILTLFVVTEPIVNGFEISDEKYFNTSAQSKFDPDKVVPILILQPSLVHVVRCMFYVARAWIPWFIFMEIVQKPGTSIMRGAGLIVRNYYMHCKASHTLRFIASMEFSFSNRIIFYVNPGVPLTREFIGKFVGFVLTLLVTRLQFNPSQINRQDVVICDHLGGCFVFRFPTKSRSHDGFENSIGKIISDNLHATMHLPLPATKLHLPEFVLSHPPCFTEGSLHSEPHSYAFQCQEGHPVYIPTYFRNSSDGKYVQVAPSPGHSCVQSSVLMKEDIHVDCFGDKISVLDSDECGNPKLSTPDVTGTKKLPTLRAVRFSSSEIFCCYAYSGLEKQTDQCNLVSTKTHNCVRKSKTPDRETHEKSIGKLWKEANEATMKSYLPLWTGCLCQGLDGYGVSSTACSLIAPLTTTTASLTTTTALLTTTTASISITTISKRPALNVPLFSLWSKVINKTC